MSHFLHGYIPNEFLTRNHQDTELLISEQLFSAIQRNAQALDLYNRLADAAPNQSHQQCLQEMMKNKEYFLRQFSSLYVSFTGGQPQYQTEPIMFDSYQEGLEKAFQTEFENSEDYRTHFHSSYRHPMIQNAIMHAFRAQQELALKLNHLRADVGNRMQDFGSNPFVVDIEKVTTENDTFRTALWTGKHLQLTLMSIDVGDDIGLEVHPETDQFIRIEEGQGLVQMGDTKDQLTYEQYAYADYAIFIPAGKWHNITNTGNTPMKVYAIYAPPEHPFGTVHKTKADAIEAEGYY
ncbi:cupin domain-containing protein [Bacillus sp. SCS-153A]|uniref:cupin domain-containing protein n=1 Tax=Rossellomorea sedimentorum TaxID=3115294 RepID=UPI003905F108